MSNPYAQPQSSESTRDDARGQVGRSIAKAAFRSSRSRKQATYTEVVIVVATRLRGRPFPRILAYFRYTRCRQDRLENFTATTTTVPSMMISIKVLLSSASSDVLTQDFLGFYIDINTLATRCSRSHNVSTSRCCLKERASHLLGFL